MIAESRREQANALMEESLLYERAYSMMANICSRASGDWNKEKVRAAKAGEPPDNKLFLLVNPALNRMRDQYRQRSDELFRQADRLADKFDEGYERLAKAVLTCAASDYEISLCGHGSKAEQALIESFAADGADMYTTLDFALVLRRIREARPRFSRYARKHAKEICAESKAWARNKTPGVVRSSAYKCPMCGGSLYAQPSYTRGEVLIKCMGCSLFERIAGSMDEDGE